MKDLDTSLTNEELIEIGNSANIDIRPFLPADRCNLGGPTIEAYIIAQGIREGLDVSIYADRQFDYQQMEQVYLGLRSGIDVSIYAVERFTSEEMKETRLCLEAGMSKDYFINPTGTWKEAYALRDTRKEYLKKKEEEREYIEKVLEGTIDITEETEEVVRKIAEFEFTTRDVHSLVDLITYYPEFATDDFYKKFAAAATAVDALELLERTQGGYYPERLKQFIKRHGSASEVQEAEEILDIFS